MDSRKWAVLAGKGMIGVVWLLLLSLPTVFIAEHLAARSRAAKVEARTHISQKPRLQALTAAYEPFVIQHLHPIFLFFYPLTRDDRKAINNEVVSVDERGFRGAGLEDRGRRKLAVLLGGSTAFGHFASSDDTTITAYLNQLQDEYFFLNAGVPSWNTTQELSRLSNQLIELGPDLVIAFDGTNDASITRKYWEEGIELPLGSPESFQALSNLVDDIRSEAPDYSALPSWYERRFPQLTRKIRKKLGSKDRDSEDPDTPLDPLLREAASKYILNLKLMQQISAANGARFIGVLQPVRALHTKIDDRHTNRSKREYYGAFRRHVLAEHAKAHGAFELHDFTAIFDREFDEVPVYDDRGLDDVDQDTIFIDSVHLLDRGNEIVARELWDRIRGSDGG